MAQILTLFSLKFLYCLKITVNYFFLRDNSSIKYSYQCIHGIEVMEIGLHFHTRFPFSSNVTTFHRIVKAYIPCVYGIYIAF